MVRKDTCPTCGKAKDTRAAECLSCGHSRKAIKQWSDPSTRQRMHSGIAAKAKTRRKRFEDIGTNTRWSYKKDDGRAFTYYWHGDTKKFIYRYQWVWMQAHGTIPEDHSIHHRNHDRTDDRLENLELLTKSDHSRLHAPEHAHAALLARGITPIAPDERERLCETCGNVFQIKIRTKSNRFCSLPCYWESLRGT